MALDEYLYGKIVNYFKKRIKTSSEIIERSIRLEDIRSRLTIFARAVTGKPIDIYPAEREGGYKNNNFFLPPSYSQFPTFEMNLSFYLFRILYLSVQKNLNLNWIALQEKTQEQSQQKAFETSGKVLTTLFNEFPIAKDLFISFEKVILEGTSVDKKPDYSWLYGKWMHNEMEKPSEKILENLTEKIKKSQESPPTTILKSKAVEEVYSIEVDKKQQEDYVLTHNFEKVETADEFNGVWRDFDGDDQLEDHKDALDELNMKFTVRVDDPAHSVYQAEFTENTTISESAEIDFKGFHLRYDEWDYSKRAYKHKFCKVYPLRQLKTDSEYYTNTIKQYVSVLSGLRKMLTNINNKMQQQQRQTQGDDFDIDAVTDMIAEIYSGHTPSDKIYLSKRKKEKDLSILLLLDISLSSDGYSNGNRVIDVEKQVSILFGEILNEFGIDFSINCFYSKTRNYSTYLTLKDFDEEWVKTKHKIGSIESQGYTRIGAALRHSGVMLDKRDTKNKWVILVSDGKPNDFDKYEGKYGISDVKQALRELNERKINSYALAIEANAKYYLPQMFGQNHYQILSTPAELLQSLIKLYGKIKLQT
jgi:nitric oxide reductase NorD protein